MQSQENDEKEQIIDYESTRNLLKMNKKIKKKTK